MREMGTKRLSEEEEIDRSVEQAPKSIGAALRGLRLK